jgi:hypothetical protein
MVRSLSLVCVFTLVTSAVCGVACGSDDEGGGGGGKGGTSGDASTGGSGGNGGNTGGSSGGGNGGSGGSSGSTGGTSGAAGGDGGAVPFEPALSQTGLYSDIVNRVIGPDVLVYEPQFVLWSDGATKNRWLYLPPGTQIDTSDMDYWVYPVGTRAWKEFTRDGKLIETRMIHKYAPNQWAMIAYEWNVAGTEALPVPTGVQNAQGTAHDIPSTADCTTCHDKMPDKLLSVSAIQLSHSLGGTKIMDLASLGKLSNPPAAPFTLPGNATDRAALGYMHANCGLCHNENSFVFSLIKMQLWLKTSELTSVADTSTYKTTVNQALTASNPTPNTFRIVPGNAGQSDVHYRMNQRGELTQMPPLASEIVDPTGLGAVDAWINSL